MKTVIIKEAQGPASGCCSLQRPDLNFADVPWSPPSPVRTQWHAFALASAAEKNGTRTIRAAQ